MVLSILIPVYNYNVFPLVKRLVAQINELSEPIEIRIYEDGSTNYLEENQKVEEFPEVIYKRMEVNHGRTALRSKMAEDACSRWLLFLDSDVLPKNNDFLKKYKNAVTPYTDVIFGGIVYDSTPPERDRMLRWVYGNKREAKPVDERMKTPYVIISQNLLIRKELFLEVNDIHDHLYGLDNYFSYRLKKLKVHVHHIDNPVIHKGLEPSEQFMKKALQAVETTVILENKNLLEDNVRPLQKTYKRIKKFGLCSGFIAFVSLFKKRMERNFRSNRPNLFWFDLYRLRYYMLLKKKGHA